MHKVLRLHLTLHSNYKPDVFVANDLFGFAQQANESEWGKQYQQHCNISELLLMSVPTASPCCRLSVWLLSLSSIDVEQRPTPLDATHKPTKTPNHINMNTHRHTPVKQVLDYIPTHLHWRKHLKEIPPGIFLRVCEGMLGWMWGNVFCSYLRRSKGSKSHIVQL